MTFEFAWKPRWAVIIEVNSWARSTFDISTSPTASTPRPFWPGAPQEATPAVGGVVLLDDVESYAPELAVAWNRLSPMRDRPAGFGNLASAMRPAITGWLVVPSMYVTLPFASIDTPAASVGMLIGT